MPGKIHIVIILVLAVIVLMLSPSTTLSQNQFNHSLDYRIEGEIRSTRLIGNTTGIGNFKSQTIRGEAVLTKTEDTYLRNHILRIDEDTYWYTPVNASDKLTVVTQSGFSAFPQSTAGAVYNNAIVNPYYPFVIDGSLIVLPLSEQNWASRIITDPGHIGQHKLTFIAAYGPGPYQENDPGYDPLYSWWLTGRDQVSTGDYYVGNYFKVEQHIYTTGGSLRRFIDLSSPFSYGRLLEFMEVTGSADVREYFDMISIPEGRKAITLNWWDIGNLHLF